MEAWKSLCRAPRVFVGAVGRAWRWALRLWHDGLTVCMCPLHARAPCLRRFVIRTPRTLCLLFILETRKGLRACLCLASTLIAALPFSFLLSSHCCVARPRLSLYNPQGAAPSSLFYANQRDIAKKTKLSWRHPSIVVACKALGRALTAQIEVREELTGTVRGACW